jgi:Ser/Thr protein kinase RdoA (MazF antagonist)
MSSIGMKTPPPAIAEDRLHDALLRHYGLHSARIDFLPKGEDAWSYVIDGDGARFLLRVQLSTRAAELETALKVTHALRVEAGLEFVVTALPTRAGGFTGHEGEFALALFPFIEGRTADESGISDAELASVATALSALHEVRPERLGGPVPDETFTLPFRDRLLALLAAVDSGDRPPREQAARAWELLRLEREDVRQTLRFVEKGLAPACRRLGFAPVVTHGDPNLANLILAPDGSPHLVDWGEVALGPLERDLMAFTGDRFGVFLAAYQQQRGGVRLHGELFHFYFTRWALQEVADYGGRLLLEAPSDEEAEHAWAELQPYLPLPHGDIAAGVRAITGE